MRSDLTALLCGSVIIHVEDKFPRLLAVYGMLEFAASFTGYGFIHGHGICQVDLYQLGEVFYFGEIVIPQVVMAVHADRDLDNLFRRI
jgi:hypothetical protein